MAVSQTERTLRGEAFEDIVIEELEKRGCTIAVRHPQRIRAFKDLPDIYAYCEGKLKRIEAKEALAWQKDASMPNEVRPGRFVLSSEVIQKECYAFGVDDQIDGTVTLDFVKAEDPDEFVRTHGQYPKYPISRLKEIRDDQRCFLDLGTVVMPREKLLEKMK